MASEWFNTLGQSISGMLVGVSSKEFVTINGIKFEVPIGSYKGQVYVPTAYPSGN